MPARNCPTCELSWPTTESYRSSFGSLAQRPVYEKCPCCGSETRYNHASVPDDPADLARAQRYAEFDTYYEQHIIRQLNEELDQWPTHAPA